ncbi:MAG: MCE family protein [Bradyrhizobium sp.]|uniref:MlaD family protein n=1 Tax=Bradyrhizobium sp. TaxID=376 RepID=UPI0025C2749F|nr:MlaD family protein [Bradyrhizobium sp.]MBI5260827.1 MCE family protein [Bradyrhizobium sp.]
MAIRIRKSNVMIGTMALAVIGVAFVGLLTVQKLRSVQQRGPIRIIIDGSASGLRKGGNVNFDGVPVGQITSIKLENPRKIVVMAMLDNSAPIRKDTVVGIEFQGLTGIAAISLVGGAPSAPPVPLDADGTPILTADLSESESIVDSLHDVDRAIAKNEGMIHDGLLSFETYTASLKSRGEAIDAVMDRAESAFTSFGSAITRIESVMPGFADGKAVELFEKVKSMHELADSFKKKSASFMEEGRRTLLDISDAANKLSFKLDPQGANHAPRPPRKPPQQRR